MRTLEQVVEELRSSLKPYGSFWGWLYALRGAIAFGEFGSLDKLPCLELMSLLQDGVGYHCATWVDCSGTLCGISSDDLDGLVFMSLREVLGQSGHWLDEISDYEERQRVEVAYM